MCAQTVEVSRGAVLALGFIIGRILRQKHKFTPAAASAADAERERVDGMEVDTSTVESSDSALDTAVSSAVHRLGEHFFIQNCSLSYLTHKGNSIQQFCSYFLYYTRVAQKVVCRVSY